MLQQDRFTAGAGRSNKFEKLHINTSSADINKKTSEIRNKISSNLDKVFVQLEDEDWIGLIFLILDESILPLEGFTLINEVKCGNIDRVSNVIRKELLSYQGPFEIAFDPLIEALYLLGRYDILEDDLQLCVEHYLHVVCRKIQALFRDRVALFQVFSDLPQQEADRLIATRLSHWHHRRGDSFEVTFLRNLNLDNYLYLLSDIHEALRQENFISHAKFLQPYARRNDDRNPVQNREDADNIALNRNLEFYPLPKCEPYGLCVIINVRNFMQPKGAYDDIPLPLRLGSDIDKQRLEGTFKLFGFNVIHLNDPTYRDINEFFARIRRDGRLYAIACLAVCVMTHGDINDNIYLSDRDCISVTELRKLCYAKALIGKPKLYFVQACRGESNLRPMFLQRDSVVASNAETDCIICTATVKGYSAMRSQSSGSWFITDLCSTLQECGHIEPLKTVLRRTREKLNKRVDKFEGSYVTQTSEDKDTLTKEVQLVRGSEETFMDGIIDLCTIEVAEELVDMMVSDAVENMDQGQETLNITLLRMLKHYNLEDDSTSLTNRS